MNAIKFIKEHGVDKAREVVAACPQYYHYYHIVEGVYYTCPKSSRVAVKDLKRLIESVDFINKFGGIDLAKAYDKQMTDNGFDPFFDKAIVDYEQLFGNTEVF